MAIQAARITGVKAGETILTEEQVLTGYEVDVRYPTTCNKTKTFSGTAGDDFSAFYDFAYVCYSVLILIEGGGATVHFSGNGVHDHFTVIVPANTFLLLPVKMQYFKIKNRVSGKNATYSIKGIYIG